MSVASIAQLTQKRNAEWVPGWLPYLFRNEIKTLSSPALPQRIQNPLPSAISSLAKLSRNEFKVSHARCLQEQDHPPYLLRRRPLGQGRHKCILHPQPRQLEIARQGKVAGFSEPCISKLFKILASQALLHRMQSLILSLQSSLTKLSCSEITPRKLFAFSRKTIIIL
jgi:hypothetical protein